MVLGPIAEAASALSVLSGIIDPAVQHAPPTLGPCLRTLAEAFRLAA